MAIIGLEGVRLRGPHGYYPEEQLLGTTFIIDLSVSIPVVEAGQQDDLHQTVNYETLYRLLKIEMKEPAQLIETLALRILHRIKEQFPDIEGAEIRLKKCNPPMGGTIDAAFIQLRIGDMYAGPKTAKKDEDKIKKSGNQRWWPDFE